MQIGVCMTVGGGAFDAPHVRFATLARGVEGAAPYGFCPANPNFTRPKKE